MEYKIDLRNCEKGDILISSLGGVLEYVSTTPYKHNTYLDHVVKYLRYPDGTFFPNDCFGTRTHNGLTFPNKPNPETDHDIIAVIDKSIANRAPIIRIFNGYVILAQSKFDLFSKQSLISNGDTFGFYTVDRANPKNSIIKSEVILIPLKHMYIVSDNIQDGDFVIETSNSNTITIFSEMSLNQKTMGCKKIEETTDPELIAKGIPQISESLQKKYLNSRMLINDFVDLGNDAKYENISGDFYKVFIGNSQKKYDLRVDLDKYVKHAIFSHVCAYHDVELTFDEWLKTTFK